MDIPRPYLMFLGDVPDQLAAKTAAGIVDWRPESCLGQIRLPGCRADLGIRDLAIGEAKAYLDEAARTHGLPATDPIRYGVAPLVDALQALSHKARKTMPTLAVTTESWPIAGSFAISRGSRTEARVVVAAVTDGAFQGRDNLADVQGRYQAVNIKLDKTGGLTEALMVAKAAADAGLVIMVGCMLGTSLAMAPAFLLTPMARFVDLDGPLLLAADRIPGISFDGSRMLPFPAETWG